MVYLLHLDRSYKLARHYLGFALHLDVRRAHHAAGSGARLIQIAGCPWGGQTIAQSRIRPSGRSPNGRSSKLSWSDREALTPQVQGIPIINQAAISWRLARTWPGDRDLERRLKRQKNSPRLCPLCRAQSGHPSRCLP